LFNDLKELTQWGDFEGDVRCLENIQEKQPATETEPGIETEALILCPPDAKSRLWKRIWQWKRLTARERDNRG